MTKQELLEKLEQLKKQREALIMSANNQIAHLSGQIDLLTELLKEEPNNEQA